MIEKFEVGRDYTYTGEGSRYVGIIMKCTGIEGNDVRLNGELFYNPLGDWRSKNDWSEVYWYKNDPLVVGKLYRVNNTNDSGDNVRKFAFVQEGRAWFRQLYSDDKVVAWDLVHEIEEPKSVTEYHLVKTENGEEKSRTKLTDDQRKELGI
jgi:hypothetical protein